MSTSSTNNGVATGPAGGAQQPIDADLPCECGYNLRGLSLFDQCPECGREIASNPWRKGAIDHRWGRRVSLGSVLLIFMTAPPTYFLLSYAGRSFLWLALTVDAVGAAGAWLISVRDPDSKRPGHDTALRWLVRLACAAWLMVSVWAYLHRVVPWGSRDVLTLLYHGLHAVALYMTFAQLDIVALRIDRRGLARWFIVCRAVIPLAALIPTAVALTEILHFFPSSSKVWGPVMFGRNVLGVAAVFLLGHLHHAVRAVTPPRLR